MYKNMCKQCSYSTNRDKHEYAIAWTCGVDFHDQKGFAIRPTGDILLNDGTVLEANLRRT